MHCPLRNFCNCCLKICFLKRKHKRACIAWCEPLLLRFETGTVELRPKLARSAAAGFPAEDWAPLVEISRLFLFFWFFSLALGYCFIFYTEGLFFYDLQPVNRVYFHKFLSETVFHMVQKKTRADLWVSRRCLHLNAQMKWRLNLLSGSFVLKCYKRRIFRSFFYLFLPKVRTLVTLGVI